MERLAFDILNRLQALDSDRFEKAMAGIGVPDGLKVVPDLAFIPWDTGGGCMMLIADLPGTADWRLGITDGDAELPTASDTFWVGIFQEDNSEVYSLFVVDGRIDGR